MCRMPLTPMPFAKVHDDDDDIDDIDDDNDLQTNKIMQKKILVSLLNRQKVDYTKCNTV